MSGGHFGGQQYIINQIADEINQIIRSNDDTSLNRWGDRIGRGYSEDTINKFKEAIELLNKSAIYAQRIDWLLSDDDSEETFHKRLKEDLTRYEITGEL